jgi:hypothetical protein
MLINVLVSAIACPFIPQACIINELINNVTPLDPWAMRSIYLLSPTARLSLPSQAYDFLSYFFIRICLGPG